MSKYNWIFQANDISTDILTDDEAIAGIAVVTYCGAYSLRQIDLAWFVEILSGFEVFEAYSQPELFHMLEKLVAIAATEGVGALFNAVYEVLAEELILDAFTAGVSVLVDVGIIAIPRAHMRLLKQLQASLDISNGEADQAIEEVLNAFEQAWEDGMLPDDGDELSGGTRIENGINIYVSPLGNFSVAVPVAVDSGGKIQPDENAVAFTDNTGLLLRIDYYPIPQEFQEQIDLYGREKYFATILEERYIPQLILAHVPKSTVEYIEYSPDIFAGGCFLILNMPQGSNLCHQDFNGTINRLNAYRGLLAFDCEQFFYIVTSQFSYTDDESIDDIRTYASMLKQEILDFVMTIKFHSI